MALVVAVAAIATAPARASAQNGELELFPPTLEPEEGEFEEPSVAPEEPPTPPILERIGPLHRLQPQGELTPDVAVTLPQRAERDPEDARRTLTLPGQAATPPPLFELAAGGGLTWRLANPGPIHYLRLDQRFEARIPDLPDFFLGAGVAELFELGSLSRVIVEAGPRFGLRTTFCEIDLVRCEGVAHVQPGIAFGALGAHFDLQAGLDARFLFKRVFLLSAGGDISFIGSGVFVSAACRVGVAF